MLTNWNKIKWTDKIRYDKIIKIEQGKFSLLPLIRLPQENRTVRNRCQNPHSQTLLKMIPISLSTAIKLSISRVQAHWTMRRKQQRQTELWTQKCQPGPPGCQTNHFPTPSSHLTFLHKISQSIFVRELPIFPPIVKITSLKPTDVCLVTQEEKQTN